MPCSEGECLCQSMFQISMLTIHSGFQTMSISEVFGEFRSSHTYSDTEGTFRPERIAQIAERFGVDPETGVYHLTPCGISTDNLQLKTTSLMRVL